VRNPEHELMAQANHDEAARQLFVGTLKLYIARQLRPGIRTIFDAEAAPDYELKNGKCPDTPEEIGASMQNQPFYQLWSVLNYTAQEQLWQSVSETILREEPRLKEAYRSFSEAADVKGSLDLAPDVSIPKVIQDTEIHLQPGGYALNRSDDDVIAGALYELGGSLYSRAQGIDAGQSKAEVIIGFLADRHPDFHPQKILDMACSAGASSTPYAKAFPDAEIHAVDVGPSLLRYAHGRAEAMGLAVHFHQRDVADTRFEDGSFDLIISHNAMHELSIEATEAMFVESYRLLKPGGICVHQDVPLRYATLKAYDKFDWGWDKNYNGEPFWASYANSDCFAMYKKAGFSDDSIFIDFAEQAGGSMKWYVACAQKSKS
jgi:SAM-dependent methyltransferase